MADTYAYVQRRLMLKGERAEITMRVRLVCPPEVHPLHIVLVLDRSGSMAGAKIKQLKDVAVELVRRLKLADDSQTRIGVVTFDRKATTLVELTNEETAVIAGIRSVQAGGGKAIDVGIGEATRCFNRGRGLAPAYTGISEVMVLFSDGRNDAGCPPVVRASDEAKKQGILSITVCVGDDCDGACLRQVASSARYHFQIEELTNLLAVFDRIRTEIRDIVLQHLVVKESLPPNMRYVDGSAQPEPKTISPDRGILEWDTNFVPTSGLTYTLRVEPLEAGFWPTGSGAELTFWDRWGGVGSQAFPVPWVQVLVPRSIATPSAPRPANGLTEPQP